MKRRAFSLSNKNSMLRSDMMSLKQKQKYNSTTNDITRKTLGAKLQQKGLHLGLAEEEEHPWLGGQLHSPRPLQPFPLRHPLISQRVFPLPLPLPFSPSAPYPWSVAWLDPFVVSANGIASGIAVGYSKDSGTSVGTSRIFGG